MATITITVSDECLPLLDGCAVHQGWTAGTVAQQRAAAARFIVEAALRNARRNQIAVAVHAGPDAATYAALRTENALHEAALHAGIIPADDPAKPRATPLAVPGDAAPIG